jgi:hypothetical protein
MSVPEYGWHIERNADPGYSQPHRLWYDHKPVIWLSTEQADSFSNCESLISDCASLVRWKDEALEVLNEWEKVYEALGSPGALGASKALSALAEVQRVTEPEQLPDGIKAGYLLDPGAKVPEGWEVRCVDGWCSTYSPYSSLVEARRIPEPDPPIITMLIPWHNAVGWKCTCGETISRVYDDIEGGPIVVCSGGDHPFVDSDGNVMVAAL